MSLGKLIKIWKIKIQSFVWFIWTSFASLKALEAQMHDLYPLHAEISLWMAINFSLSKQTFSNVANANWNYVFPSAFVSNWCRMCFFCNCWIKWKGNKDGMFIHVFFFYQGIWFKFPNKCEWGNTVAMELKHKGRKLDFYFVYLSVFNTLELNCVRVYLNVSWRISWNFN